MSNCTVRFVSTALPAPGYLFRGVELGFMTKRCCSTSSSRSKELKTPTTFFSCVTTTWWILWFSKLSCPPPPLVAHSLSYVVLSA
jgi:hypothetical protein